MAEQALNRLYVLALADKKGGEAVAEVVEPESLAGFQSDANLNRGGTNFIFRHHAGAHGVLSFIFVLCKLLYVPELQKF